MLTKKSDRGGNQRSFSRIASRSFHKHVGGWIRSASLLLPLLEPPTSVQIWPSRLFRQVFGILATTSGKEKYYRKDTRNRQDKHDWRLNLTFQYTYVRQLLAMFWCGSKISKYCFSSRICKNVVEGGHPIFYDIILGCLHNLLQWEGSQGTPNWRCAIYGRPLLYISTKCANFGLQ